MSVLVKGMEMPEDCRNCPFEMYYMNCGETKCRATGKILADFYKPIPFEGRAEECPLVEVPPHGRLIDADAMKSVIETYLKIQEDWATETVMPDCKDRAGAMVTAYINCIKAIERMPTIIEEET